MNLKESSRRECFQADATATKNEVGSFRIGDTTKANINCSTQAAQREPYSQDEQRRRQREACQRIERQREQQQAARYFCQLQRGCVRRV